MIKLKDLIEGGSSASKRVDESLAITEARSLDMTAILNHVITASQLLGSMEVELDLDGRERQLFKKSLGALRSAHSELGQFRSLMRGR